MTRKTAIFTIVGTLAFIVATMISSLDLSSPRSEQWQDIRMYLVFAAYLLLLFGVRSLLKTRVASRPHNQWWRVLRLTVASISIAGAAYVLGIVLTFVFGGPGSVGPMMLPLLCAAPAVALALLPLVSKHMT
jgi:predicted membrane channel-forming protein YqfA (hemolysin III family)